MIKDAFLLFRHSSLVKLLVVYCACSTAGLLYYFARSSPLTRSCPYKWAGGSPTGKPIGSCWCGWDSYCMCTPSLAIDIVLEKRDDSGQVTDIALVNRLDGGGLATCGGFVSVGEKVGDAMIREVFEETGLTISDYNYWKVYSDPTRDKRRHTVSVTYTGTYAGTPRGGDDAKEVVVIPIDKLRNMVLARIGEDNNNQDSSSSTGKTSSSASSSSNGRKISPPGPATFRMGGGSVGSLNNQDGSGISGGGGGVRFAFDHALILYEYFEAFHKS